MTAAKTTAKTQPAAKATKIDLPSAATVTGRNAVAVDTNSSITPRRVATPIAKAAGTGEGRITATRLTPGAKVLVTTYTGPAMNANGAGRLNLAPGALIPASRKTGAMIATVTGTGKGGSRRVYIETDLGTLHVGASQTFALAPLLDASWAAPKAKAATRRGAAKTGDPAADRAINDAKSARAAAKLAPKAKAPVQRKPAAATPAKAPASVKLPTGYEVRWTKGAFDLAKKVDASIEGAAWLVVCTAHGTTTAAPNTVEANLLGRKASRRDWCKSCKG